MFRITSETYEASKIGFEQEINLLCIP